MLHRIYYRLKRQFFPEKKSTEFPRLLASTPIDKSIKAINEYRAFIDSLSDHLNCDALYDAALGNDAHVNIYIKDWVYTARSHHSPFIEKVICEKYHELANIYAKEPLKIGMSI